MSKVPRSRLCPLCSYRGTARTCPHDGLPTIYEAFLEQKRAAPDLIGKIFEDRYEVLAPIGSGASGWVFRARHMRVGHEVALKVLRPDLGTDMVQVKRFYREAQSSCQLRSPHVIGVHDFGATDDGYLYIVMELLEGRGLHELIHREAPLSPERAIRIARQVCEALDEAHSRGLVHRDLKPENIFLTDDRRGRDFVTVLDFGLSKLSEPGEASITRVGWIVGTPTYMAPEQATGRPVDGRTDLYALGCVLYAMLAGRPPFWSEDPEAVLLMHVKVEPPALPQMARGRTIPEALRGLVAALLSKQPDARPPSAAIVDQVLATVEAQLTPGSDQLPALQSEPAFGLGELTAAELGKAAEEVAPPPQEGESERPVPLTWGPSPRWIAGSLAAVAIAVLAWLVVGGTHKEPAPAGEAPVVVEVDPGSSAEEPAAFEGGEARETAETEPRVVELALDEESLTVIAPEPQRVTLVTAPEGAEVRDADSDQVIGQTPLEVILDEDAKSLTLNLKGYVATNVLLDESSPEEVSLTLEREPKRARAKARRAAKAKPKPKRSKLAGLREATALDPSLREPAAMKSAFELPTVAERPPEEGGDKSEALPELRLAGAEAEARAKTKEAAPAPAAPPMEAPAPTRVVVDIASLSVKGSLTSGTVRRAVASKLRAIRSCGHALATRTRLDVRFTIDEDGRATRVAVEGAGSAGLSACVRRALTRLRTRRRPDTGVVPVRVSLAFRPEGA